MAACAFCAATGRRPHTKACLKHYRKGVSRQRLWQKRRLAAGLCYRCGDRQTCLKCKERFDGRACENPYWPGRSPNPWCRVCGDAHTCKQCEDPFPEPPRMSTRYF